MGRNIRETIQKVFDNLAKGIVDDDIERKTSYRRSIFFDEDTYTVIEKTKIITQENAAGTDILYVEYNDKKYLVVKSEQYTDCFKNEYENVDKALVNGLSILSVLYGFCNIKKSKSSMEIVDSFFSWQEDSEFKCEDIICFYDEIRIFLAEQLVINLECNEDINRLGIIISCDRKIRDRLMQQLFEQISELMLLESSRGVVNIVNNIFQTSSTKLIFLQLYRMLEYLYIMQRGKILSEKYDLDVGKTIKMLSDEKIKYTEYIQIQTLLEKCASNSYIYKYVDYLKNKLMWEFDKEKNVEKVAKYIYDNRCKIAHYKYGQQKIEDEEYLQESVIILAQIVSSVFTNMDQDVVNINNYFKTWKKYEDDAM